MLGTDYRIFFQGNARPNCAKCGFPVSQGVQFQTLKGTPIVCDGCVAAALGLDNVKYSQATITQLGGRVAEKFT